MLPGIPTYLPILCPPSSPHSYLKATADPNAIGSHYSPIVPAADTMIPYKLACRAIFVLVKQFLRGLPDGPS